MDSQTATHDVYAAPQLGRAPRAVYIHVPFCIHRCGYCDFTLVAGKDELIPSYLKAMENELSTIDSIYEVDSIFIGGGTPSHLNTQQLTKLLELIHARFQLTPTAEFTLEANPDGLDQEKLSALAALGVNRLSLGVQSFDSAVLQTLERRHSPELALEVLANAGRVFDNVSLDLIFGVPGQSLSNWEETLDIATRLPLQHLSTYGLTFEKGTDFFKRQQSGNLQSVPEELERTMYDVGMSTLSAAGFGHYEISNFAKPSHRCRHNMVYWTAEEYFAFGPGAARYINGVRSTNARSVTRWLNSWLQGEPALQEVEVLSMDAKIREGLFLGLRMIEGIDIAAFTQKFAVDPRTIEARAFEMNIAHGLLEVVNNHMRLTDEGRFVADSVVTDFL